MISNGFSSLNFTDINRSVISAAYDTSNKYFGGLFKTPSWRPGVYSKPGVWLSKYGTLQDWKLKPLDSKFKDQCSILKTFNFKDQDTSLDLWVSRYYQLTFDQYCFIFWSNVPNLVVPENIHNPPIQGIGNSWGWGFSKTEKKKKERIGCMEFMEFPEGWAWGVLNQKKKNPFCREGMDQYFMEWKYTL